MVGIYKITNKINGKVYIGQSVNIGARWTQHRTRPFRERAEQYNSPLYRSIRKYGLSNFLFEVIEETKAEDLNKAEIKWINYYQSTDPSKGYNLSTGGEGSCYPLVLTSQQVQEIRQALMYSNESETKIATKYNVSQRTISSINLGQTWFDSSYNYPLQSYRPAKEDKQFLCPVCGKIKKSSRSQMCEECARKNRRVVDRPNREELKTLIRKTPFTTIAAQYGVTDNAVRKWCDAEGLPRKVSIIKSLSDEEWLKI